MNGPSAEQVYEAVRKERLVAIVRGASPEQIVKIGQALYEGGVTLIEVTANTAGFEDMIAALRQTMAGKMSIGAGTVTTVDLAEAAVAAGAQFIVAPDVNPEVITWSVERGLGVIPGAATPTEILTAKRLGAGLVKIFPAGSMGGDYIKQLRGPINDYGFVAVGGVDCSNAADYIRAGCVAVGLGSGLVRKDLVANGDWYDLTQLAADCLAKVQGV